MILMLDSNVVIDALARREPFYELSYRVCALGITGEADTYVSVSMLTDIFYLLRKEHSAVDAQRLLLESSAYLKVCGVSAEDGLACLRQGWHDFEDCLVARCAENVKADYIVTRNPQDFRASLVPALSPDDLFALLKARDGLTYRVLDLS
jgi:predicted nucleic acid-binding protein